MIIIAMMWAIVYVGHMDMKVIYIVLAVMIPVGYIMPAIQWMKLHRLMKVGVIIKTQITSSSMRQIRNGNYWTVHALWVDDREATTSSMRNEDKSKQEVDGDVNEKNMKKQYEFVSGGYRYDTERLVGLPMEVIIDPSDPTVYVVNDLQIPKRLEDARSLESVNLLGHWWS